MKTLFRIALSIHISLLSIFAAEKPNFLFILVDDQSPFDLKAYDPDSILHTPNIDRIAREGMVIDSAHQQGAWTGAVCTSSRTMIMTGRTLWHVPGAPGSGKGNKPVPPGIENFTLPAVFNAAGYETVRTCKQGNSYEPANRKFQIRHDATKRGGTAESGSVWHGDQVMNYLADRVEKDVRKPFLIYYGFSHPHDTRDGTPELLSKYGATNHTEPHHPPRRQPETTLPPRQLASGTSFPHRPPESPRRGRRLRRVGQARRAHRPQRAWPRVRLLRKHRHPDRAGAR